MYYVFDDKVIKVDNHGEMNFIDTINIKHGKTNY